MKLIKPSFTILQRVPELEGVYKQIELAGRTCYKSEDKITPDSAKAFTDRMVNSGHGAMLEHGTIYLKIPYFYIASNYINNKHSVVSIATFKRGGIIKYESDLEEHPDMPRFYYVTTNYRVLVENNWLNDLQYLCEPTKYHEKRIAVRFVCDRGVSHEFVRHRVFSFAQESTRFCNYSKDKFNNELTFIQPCYLDEVELANFGPYHLVSRSKSPESIFVASLNNAEKDYLTLIKSGWKAQEARAILPSALKTELVMTGFLTDWRHFFELRCASNAHPQARELAIPLYEEFQNQHFIL